MNCFRNIFGKKKKVQTREQTIEKLRELEDMLTTKQGILEKQIELQIAVARESSTKNKRVAIQALKRKKRYEKSLKEVDRKLATLEKQREDLEDVDTNRWVLTTMKNAGDALKTAYNDMDVDQMHEMMHDIAEQHGVAREISDAISYPAGSEQNVELERELEELEQAELDRRLQGIGATGEPLTAVSVPVKPVKSKKAAKKKCVKTM